MPTKSWTCRYHSLISVRAVAETRRLLRVEDAKVLIDQGFSGKTKETRLARMDIRPQEIDAIVLTHHHGDHGGGASIAQRRWDIPIYL